MGFAALAEHRSPLVADSANMLFLTSVFAAPLSSTTAWRATCSPRTVRMCCPGPSRGSTRSGGLFTGSLSQSLLAADVLVVFVLAGSDPILQLFTWFSGMVAVGSCG